MKFTYDFGKAGHELLKQLYSQPIMNASQIAQLLEVTHQSASSLARSFEEIGILKQSTGFKRNRLFVFSEYLKLFTNPVLAKPESLSTKRISKSRIASK